MIGVQGQYLVQFSIGPFEDFISEIDFRSFTIIEDAGNSLPTFMLSFLSWEEDILNYLNERNDLLVSMGEDINNRTTSRLTIKKIEMNKIGQDRRVITVAGFYSASLYQGNTKRTISENKSAIEVIQETVKPHFLKVDSNIEKSTDSQKWVQYNITDRKFVNDLWLRSHLPNSFVALGITSDGIFRIRDIKKTFKQNYTWRFVESNPSKKNDILHDGNTFVKSSSGFINDWVGYDRERLIYSLEDEIGNFNSSPISPALALTKNLDKKADITKRFASTSVINENTHEWYWSCYQRNLASLAQFSSLMVSLTFSTVYLPVKVLDLVMLNESSIKNPTQNIGFYSGLYLVSKVSRTIMNRKIKTLVQLVREAPNMVK